MAGTGTGLAQDVDLQAIITALGGPIVGMPNGTGTGLAQDASLQQISALIVAGPLGTTIRFAIGTGAAQSSTHKIPAGAIVLRAYLDITTPYSPGATISLGTAANASLFMATSDSDPQVAALYDALQDTAVAAQNPMLVTVAGGPAAGAGFACVVYSVPLG